MGLTVVSPVTNDAERIIDWSKPYTVTATVQGTADLLLHRWSVEGVEAKGKAAKGSKAKKSDDLESYVYRTPDGEIALPGEYLRQAVIGAAKFRQDPRSPRKSAQDLVKAGVVCLTELASLGISDWDYIDRRRVMVQRSGITRERPAIAKGWRATVDLMVLLPEYIESDFLNDLIQQAGRLIGVADFRPTYGRFQVVEFNVWQDA